MNWTIIFAWLCVIIATEALTEIITTSKITEPFRDWVGRSATSQFRLWFSELINCGYCTSVWVSIVLAAALPTPGCKGCAGSVGFLIAIMIYGVKVLFLHRTSNLFHELAHKWFSRSPLNLVLTHVGANHGRRKAL